MDAVVGKNNGFDESDQWHKPKIKEIIKISIGQYYNILNNIFAYHLNGTQVNSSA